MRARGSRSNARGDRRLQLVLLPRLFAQGRAWRLVTPIQASFVALRGSGEMSERSTALLARTAGIHSRQAARSAIHRFPNQPHDSILRPHADDEDALSGSDCRRRNGREAIVREAIVRKATVKEAIVRKATVREAIVREAIVREAKGRADGGTGTHHGLRRN
jgi:hypothetical protein